MPHKGEAVQVTSELGDALQESGFLDTLDGNDIDPFEDLANGSDEGTEVPSADGTAASGDGASAGENGSEAGDGTDDVLPDDYWGTSLEGLSDEQKQNVISALSQRDSTIRKLQAELAKEPEAPAAPEEPEDPVEITDDAILAAILGDLEQVSPDELEYARKTALPLAKQLMNLEETVEKLSETESIRETSSFWNSSLDKLEEEYGKIPGATRTQVLQYAAREGIGDPEVLYSRLVLQQRKAIDSEVAKVRQQSAKRVASGGLPPRSTDGGKKVLDTKDKSLKDVVREAAFQAQEDAGLSWKDVFRKGHAGAK